MRYRSTYFEIQDLIIQFANAFDSIVIGRYNKNREQKDRIFVRYVYSPKQRVLYDIVNKAKTITLPVVAINVSDIQRDNNRVFNKLPDIGGFTYINHGKHNKYNAPTPVNIEMNLTVITRYQLDMDQILSNFIPYNNPYIIISWPVPPGLVNLSEPQEIRSEVLWSGSIDLEYPVSLKGTDKARVVANTSFTIKGWIFPAAVKDLNNIYIVDSSFTSVSSGTVLDESSYPYLSAMASDDPINIFNATEQQLQSFRSNQT